MGLSGLKLYSHDVFAMLDGAWRMMNGQRPHIDFYSGLGPLAYLPSALGLLLAGGIGGYSDAQAAFGFLLGVWIFLIARNRLSDIATATTCFVVVLLSVTPKIIGHSPQLLTPASAYNRFGYAFLAILIIEALCAARRNRSIDRIAGGFSTGAIVGLLLFLKISYFLEALLLLFGLAILRKKASQRWAGVAFGFATIFLCFAAYMRFNLAPMFNDLAMVSASRHFLVSNVWTLFYSAERDMLPFGIFLTAVTLVSWRYKETLAVSRLTLAAILVCCVGVLALLSNGGQPSGLPLDVVMVIIVFDGMTQEFQNGREIVRDALDGLTVLMVAAGAILVSLFPILSDTLALSDGVFQRIVLTKTLHNHKQFNSPRLVGYLTLQEDDADAFNEGADLLHRYGNANATLTVLDFSNPFSYALAMPPQHGGTTWLQWQINFDRRHGPTGKWLMGSADLVLLPKEYVDPPDNDNIPRVYGPYLHSNFVEIAESKHWFLYHRRA